MGSVRIRIRQPFNRLQLGIKEGFAIGPLEGPQDLMHGTKLDGRGSGGGSSSSSNGNWSVCPPELAAVNQISSYVNLYLSPCFYDPIAMCATERMCLGLLDASVFLGCDTPQVREKLSLALAVMHKQAEIWPLARRLAASIREVAAAYLAPVPTRGGGAIGSTINGNNATGAAVRGAEASFASVGDPDHVWQDAPVFPAVSMADVGHHATTMHTSYYPPPLESHYPVPTTMGGDGGFDDWLVAD